MSNYFCKSFNPHDRYSNLHFYDGNMVGLKAIERIKLFLMSHESKGEIDLLTLPTLPSDAVF